MQGLDVDGTTLNQEGLGKLIAYFISLESGPHRKRTNQGWIHGQSMFLQYVSICFSISLSISVYTDMQALKQPHILLFNVSKI